MKDNEPEDETGEEHEGQKRREPYELVFDLIKASYKVRGLGYLIGQDVDQDRFPEDIAEIRQGIELIAADIADAIYTLSTEVEAVFSLRS